MRPADETLLGILQNLGEWLCELSKRVEKLELDKVAAQLSDKAADIANVELRG